MEVWWPPIKVYFTPFTNMTIRVFEAFAGVGSQRMALRNLGIDHEVVAISDVDEFTVKSYAAIHDNDKTVSQVTDDEMQDYLEERNIPLNDKGVRKILKGKKLREFYEACIKSNNLGDISRVVTQDIPDHDLFTYSFPCQDISVAGKGLGLDEGSETRSGLLWECQKVIAGKKPKYLLLENVKNLVGKKHKPNFDKWLEWLETQGYTNYWEVLNAKNYSVPQNRERVFVVSILGDHEPYKFPEPVELELRLKDVLESEVDEKFYLDEEKTEQLISRFDLEDEPFLLGGEQKNQAIKKDGVSTTLTSSMGTGGGYVPMVNRITGATTDEPKAERIGGIFDKDGKTHQAGAVWDKEQLSPTLDTMQGGWRQPSVVIGEIVKDFDIPKEILNDNERQRRVYNTNGISPAVLARTDSAKITTVQKDNYVVEPLGTLAAHNSDKFGTGYMDGISKTLKANKHDISVVEQVRWLAESARPNVEIGVTLRPNGDIRPHRMDIKKSGIQELNVNHEDNPSHTVTSAHMPKVYGDVTDFRIRKLTPLECWRLMGFSDEDFRKAEAVNSNSQLYKQAGNSIVVNVLEAIFKQLSEEK